MTRTETEQVKQWFLSNDYRLTTTRTPRSVAYSEFRFSNPMLELSDGQIDRICRYWRMIRLIQWKGHWPTRSASEPGQMLLFA
ncbi:MAG: hypothetical protein IPK83_18625 [Planctomycetes bacterium]|nr:hypothetical protein [Planctomycetota bacterium]